MSNEAPKVKEGEANPARKKKLPRRHTGYAFDHPGFESFHANEVRPWHLEYAKAFFASTANSVKALSAFYLPSYICPLPQKPMATSMQSRVPKKRKTIYVSLLLYD